MNGTVQTLWIGPVLSSVEHLSLTSFLENGHEVHLFVYENVQGVPDGVTILDAKDVLPSHEIFTVRNSYAIFADWFRWELLFKKGGYWVDTDVICLKPFSFDDEIVFGLENSTTANIAVLRFPKEHPLSRSLADLCKAPNSPRPNDTPKMRRKKFIRKYLKGNRREHLRWGESGGPQGFTAELKHLGLFELAKPFTYFYPVPANCWLSQFDETFQDNDDFFSGSYCTHLWNEFLNRSEGFDKNANFHPDSIFEKLKQRYLD